jgi:hypothetical protein
VVRAPWLAAALALSACGAQFHPETLVDSLRVLSVVARNPELNPGGQTTLSALRVEYPPRVGGFTSVFWIGCDPDPVGFNRSTCSDVSALLQPDRFSDFPPDVALLGFGDSVTYSTKASVFDGLDAGDPVRVNGTAGPVLMVLVAAEVTPTTSLADLRVIFEKMVSGALPNVLAITRVTISTRATLNTNPQLSRLTVDGVELPDQARLQVRPGAQVRLHLEAPPEAREAYQLILPSGTVDSREKLVAAWYSTGGRFSLARVDLDSGEDTVFTAPGGLSGDPVPAGRFGSVWEVLRDDRGGESNRTISYFVCDDSPTPTVTSVTLPTSAGQQTRVRGTHLEGVLDLVIGGQVLRNAYYDPVGDVLLGDAPPLSAGTWPVRVRGRNCTDLDPGFSVTVAP